MLNKISQENIICACIESLSTGKADLCDSGFSVRWIYFSKCTQINALYLNKNYIKPRKVKISGSERKMKGMTELIHTMLPLVYKDTNLKFYICGEKQNKQKPK